jgi:hypothetical protein
MRVQRMNSDDNLSQMVQSPRRSGGYSPSERRLPLLSHNQQWLYHPAVRYSIFKEFAEPHGCQP